MPSSGSNTPHHRRSVRIPTHDYAGPGAYFVTIVTADRACIFGAVAGDEMHLSDWGRMAQDCWQSIPLHFPHAELGAYVVMPNHVHGILVLHDRTDGSDGAPWHAPTEDAPWRAPTGRFGKPVSGSLATIIGQYKSSVTRLTVQQFGGAPRIWQRNYYEHIIRDEHDWSRIDLYIRSNVVNWAKDEENVGR